MKSLARMVVLALVALTSACGAGSCGFSIGGGSGSGAAGSGTPASAPAPTTRPRPPAAEVATVVETGRVAPGGEARVALEVRLPPKMHVQSNQPKDPLFIPTVLTVNAPPGVTVANITYPPSEQLAQAGLAEPLIVYGSQFRLNVRLNVARTATPGPIVIPASLRYQACDDTTCYTPRTAEASWSLEIK